MPVPPLKHPDWVENDPSFHKLEPPRNSMKRACLRHDVSGSLVSCSIRISTSGVDFWKSVFNSLRFLSPEKALTQTSGVLGCNCDIFPFHSRVVRASSLLRIENLL